MKELYRSIKVEFRKTKSPALFAAVIGIPLLGVTLGSLSFLTNQSALKGNPWFDLWTQVALFYGYFFYPLLLSVIASYLWRVEHQRNNWNALYSNALFLPDIWFSKLFILFVYALMCQVLIFLLYLGAGFLLKISGYVPSFFWWWILGGTLGALAPSSVQLYLSMRIKSFSLPSALCFILCLAGMGAYAKGWWFFPYTLSIIGVGAQHEFMPSGIEILKVFFGVFFWIALTSVLAIRYLRKRDV